MSVKCVFCNDTRIEKVDGKGVDCVWCDPVGLAIVDDTRQRLAKRHTIANLRYSGGEEHNVKYVSEVYFDRVFAEREALQQRLTVQDQRVDDLGLEVEGVTYRLEVMTADRDELLRKLEILRAFAEQIARQEGEPYYASLAKAAINPTADAVSPANVCSGCGASGWTGNCSKCIPY